MSYQLTAERFDRAKKWLNEHTDMLSTLDKETRLVAALGLLVADHTGHASEDDMRAAAEDREAIWVASLLAKMVE